MTDSPPQLPASGQDTPELLRAEAALRQSEERLRMAVDAGEVGIWDWDMATQQVTWSDRIYQMHQMAPGSPTGGFEGFRDRIT